MGRAGIVLGLEVSRLARNSTDWHRLLEICALTDTLILDEDGIYDPAHFNDRLLLGLKGTMSEAELHVMRARLRGGLLNKARRGELRCPPPVGLVCDEDGRVVLDPDQEVQETMRLLFETFARTGAVHATIKHFRQQGLLFPRRLTHGARKGEVAWAPLSLSRAARALHNPWYAGAYVYGRGRWCKLPNGRVRHERLPQEQWQVLIRDAHPGYISWERYESIQEQLRASAKAIGFERQGPPREGAALLQGRVVCGLCGSRMHAHYNVRRRDGELMTNYVCTGRGWLFGDPLCQSVVGTAIDASVSNLLLEAVTPMALELALAVQHEIARRLEEADRLRHRRVERAQYEAERARHRYMQVDPTNRLVADSLEADWNAKLAALAEAQQDYHRQRASDRLMVDDQERQRVLALAADFPAVWRAPTTSQRERKRMLALLIEDVTLIKQRHITVAVRFGGGHDHVHIASPVDGRAVTRHGPGGARANRYLAGRVHRRPGRARPQRAWRQHGCWGHVRHRQHPVGPLLRQAQEPQAASARGGDADREGGLHEPRRESDQPRPVTRPGADRGSHLQRQGRVALLATAARNSVRKDASVNKIY